MVHLYYYKYHLIKAIRPLEVEGLNIYVTLKCSKTYPFLKLKKNYRKIDLTNILSPKLKEENANFCHKS